MWSPYEINGFLAIKFASRLHSLLAKYMMPKYKHLQVMNFMRLLGMCKKIDETHVLCEDEPS